MPEETPQHIAQLRQVTAELVLAGRFDPARYPHRHLAVLAMKGTWWYQRLATALAAVDLLAPAGFELVDVSEFPAGNAVCATVRRR
ncbi:MAG TPA: transcriptional regulator [Micromonospora sp.]